MLHSVLTHSIWIQPADVLLTVLQVLKQHMRGRQSALVLVPAIDLVNHASSSLVSVHIFGFALVVAKNSIVFLDHSSCIYILLPPSLTHSSKVSLLHFRFIIHI